MAGCWRRRGHGGQLGARGSPRSSGPNEETQRSRARPEGKKETSARADRGGEATFSRTTRWRWLSATRTTIWVSRREQLLDAPGVLNSGKE